MEDIETPHTDYTKGFNEGYTIAKHLPGLAEELAKAVSDTPRGMGFVHGRDQLLAEVERDLDRRPEWLRGPESPKGLFDLTPEKNAIERDLTDKPGKDKGDIEPES